MTRGKRSVGSALNGRGLFFWLLLDVALLLLGMSTFPGAAQDRVAGSQQLKIVGTVKRIDGTVRWRPDRKTDGKVLDAVKDRGRELHAGESLSCDPGSRLVIQIYGRELELDVRLGWYPIPFVPAVSQGDWYGPLGGRYAFDPFRPRVIG